VGAGCFNRGDNDLAIFHFQMAWQYGPTDENAALCLGNAYMRKGDLERARQAFEAGLESSRAFGIFKHGNLRPDGFYGVVDRVYRPLLAPAACAPDFLSIYERKRVEYTTDMLLSFARLELKEHGFEAAEQHWNRAMALSPKSPRPYMARGEELEKLDRIDEAERDLRFAATLSKSSADPFGKLATMLQRKGDAQGSAEALEECLRRDPANANGNLLRAGIASSHGDFNEAEACLRRAIAADPFFLESKVALAELLWKRGNIGEVIDLLEQARVIDPDNADVRIALSQAYRQFGRYKKSAENLKEALTHKLTPEAAAKVKAGLAWVLATSPDAELRNGAEALRLADEACAHSKSARNLDALAAAYGETGDFEHAIQTAHAAQSAAESEQQPAFAAEIIERIQLYQDKKPFRE
jgi:tetratricopeptide (TPR) repeat protein